MLQLNVSFLVIILATGVHCLELDENMCYTEERYTELEQEKTTQPVKIRSYNWCLSFPPRCSNYRTEIRDVIKLQNVTKTKLVERCCEGYNNITLDNETTICVPMCRGGCGQGVCESPNTCLCNVGYEGLHCDQRCRPRRYGTNCKSICKCRNGSLCDKNGFCRCATGWIGKYCENPCPKGQYGMMCHKACQCNNNHCDPQTGECLPQNSKILFDLSHNRSSNIMRLSSDRIKAKHWIPVNGNGKISIRNCSELDGCEKTTVHGRNIDESIPVQIKDDNSTALIHELNTNLSNLTKELKKNSDKSVAIVVNSSIAIHHIHEMVSNSGTNRDDFQNSLIPPNTEINFNETENQQIIYDQLNEFDDSIQSIDDNSGEVSEEFGEIDSIGGYNNVVHVFSMSSINTTKSEQIVTLPPMIPVTLILLIILCVTFVIVFGTIYFIRKSKETQAQQNPTTHHENITLSDQIEIPQKPLPEIPSFTQSISSQRVTQQDLYDRPSNNRSVKSGLNRLGYSYADNENCRRVSGNQACDEHIYDEIKYSNYCQTTQR